MVRGNKMTIMAITLIFALSLLSIQAIYAEGAKIDPAKDTGAGRQSKPTGHIVGNRIILNSTMITAEFEGQKPKIKFYYTGDDRNVTRFYVNYKQIIEYEDKNLDGVFQNNESTARFELESARWSHTDLYNVMNGSKVVGIGINFTVETPIHIAGKGGASYDVMIKVVTRIYQNRTTERINRDGKWVNYTINAGEIKTDLLIGNWPFSSSKNKLAFEADLVENILHETKVAHRFEIAEDKNVTKAKSSLNETTLGYSEHRIKPPKNETRINFVGESSNKIHAFFKFVNTAFVTNKTGTYLVNVNSSYLTHGDALRVYISYPYFNGTVEHDPSLGVVGENYPIPQLSIKSLTVDKPTLTEGDSLTATCIIDSVGELNASKVVATVTAPGFEISQPSKTIGTITAGSSETVTFGLKALKAGSYSINVTLTATDADTVSKLVSVNVGVNYLPYIMGTIIAIAAVSGVIAYLKLVRKPRTV